MASYFRIAQAKDGGKTLQKLANRRMKSMQPSTPADLAQSLAVGQAYIKKQKGTE